jgi:hypothetical protein
MSVASAEALRTGNWDALPSNGMMTHSREVKNFNGRVQFSTRTSLPFDEFPISFSSTSFRSCFAQSVFALVAVVASQLLSTNWTRHTTATTSGLEWRRRGYNCMKQERVCNVYVSARGGPGGGERRRGIVSQSNFYLSECTMNAAARHETEGESLRARQRSR